MLSVLSARRSTKGVFSYELSPRTLENFRVGELLSSFIISVAAVRDGCSV